MAGLTYRAHVASNERLPCDAPRCKLNRHHGGRWCRAHSRAQMRYGHPHGRRFYAKDYDLERKVLTRVIRLSARRNHAGIAYAEEWIARWMQQAVDASPKTPTQIHLCRLWREGVTPREVLTMSAACFSYSWRNESVLPSDDRRTLAIGLVVAFLRKRDFVKAYAYPSGERRVYREVHSATRRELGQTLLDALTPLYVNLTEAIGAHERNQQAARDALRAPLTLPKPSNRTTNPTEGTA